MWNLLKDNKEIESLNEQISELQSRIEKQNEIIENLTEDRDYWKSQYEKFITTYEPEDAKLGAKVKVWTSKKMLHCMESHIELQKLKSRISYAKNPEEAFEILEKAAAIKKENEILRELGDIILEIMNKD